MGCARTKFTMTSSTFAPTVPSKVKVLAFHTMTWLRSSPGISSENSMMISSLASVTSQRLLLLTRLPAQRSRR